MENPLLWWVNKGWQICSIARIRCYPSAPRICYSTSIKFFANDKFRRAAAVLWLIRVCGDGHLLSVHLWNTWRNHHPARQGPPKNGGQWVDPSTQMVSLAKLALFHVWRSGMVEWCFSGAFQYPCRVYHHLVGGFKHFLFSIIYGMSSFPLTNSIIFQDGHIAPPTSHPFSDSLMRISSFPELVLPRSSPGHPRPQMFSSSGLYISVHLYHRFNKTIAIISVLFLPQVTAPNFHLKRGDPGETQIFSVPRQWPQLYDGGFKMVQIKCIKMCHPFTPGVSWDDEPLWTKTFQISSWEL